MQAAGRHVGREAPLLRLRESKGSGLLTVLVTVLVAIQVALLGTRWSGARMVVAIAAVRSVNDYASQVGLVGVLVLIRPVMT